MTIHTLVSDPGDANNETSVKSNAPVRSNTLSFTKYLLLRIKLQLGSIVQDGVIDWTTKNTRNLISWRGSMAFWLRAVMILLTKWRWSLMVSWSLMLHASFPISLSGKKWCWLCEQEICLRDNGWTGHSKMGIPQVWWARTCRKALFGDF